jgi:flavin reductase (DIM6/NTAB) family NADH-FMN oxidoreductase RutF
MKKRLDGANLLYPTPTVLVGALVDGRPNFATIAHVGIMNKSKPHYLSMSINRARHTSVGIREHKTFSVNVPSEEHVGVTDYCGITSGSKQDKSGLFEVFYGQLETAPMIAAFPLNMECRVFDVYELPTHEVFIGEIVEAYAEESVLVDGLVDIGLVRPLLFDNHGRNYWGLGDVVAKAWSVGRTYQAE